MDKDLHTRRSWRSKLAWWLDPRQWVRAILMLDDTPHSIALGTAIGIFVAFTPTVGVQMVLVMLIAFLTSRLFHFNRVAGLIAVYLSNPFTMVPIYWFNYRLGTMFLKETVSQEEFARLFQYTTFSEWQRSLRAIFFTVGTPLLIGSLLVGLFFGLLSYLVIRRLTERVQAHRRHKHMAKPAS
ncbi:MAG: DUF2062 domain-containing protein [Planctomycetaceae bacterium]|nr:DUF2062 domain-containing protein [Planctomycetaceae bacterium]